MGRWAKWAVAAGALLTLSGCALLNFMATVDLAYDITDKGRSLLRWWGYAALGLLLCALAAAATAMRLWLIERGRRRDGSLPKI